MTGHLRLNSTELSLQLQSTMYSIAERCCCYRLSNLDQLFNKAPFDMHRWTYSDRRFTAGCMVCSKPGDCLNPDIALNCQSGHCRTFPLPSIFRI